MLKTSFFRSAFFPFKDNFNPILTAKLVASAFVKNIVRNAAKRKTPKNLDSWT